MYFSSSTLNLPGYLPSPPPFYLSRSSCCFSMCTNFRSRFLEKQGMMLLTTTEVKVMMKMMVVFSTIPSFLLYLES